MTSIDVGILMMSSIVTHGRNKKGHLYKTFKPYRSTIDNNDTCNESKSGRPLLIKVATSMSTTHDHYIIVKIYKKEQPAEKDLNVYQRGELVEVIGPAGDSNAERDYILAKHQLNFRPYSNSYTKKTFDATIQACPAKINTVVAHGGHGGKVAHGGHGGKVAHGGHGDCIISIDPPGCKDIDDCIGYTALADKFMLAIHIADVTSLVDSHHDAFLSKRPTSIYMDHKTLNMLPDKLIHYCSLLPGEQRMAHSIIIEVPLLSNLHKIDSLYDLSYRIHETSIVSKKAFTYQQVNDIIQKHSPEKKELQTSTVQRNDKYNLHALNELTRALSQHFNLMVSSDPAHRIVETCMMLANALVGHYLYTTNVVQHGGGMVARCHDESVAINLEDTKDSIIHDHLIKMASASAQYRFIHSLLDTEPHSHAGLGLKHYVHFTSPIRRFADIMTHRLIKDSSYKVYPEYIDVINNVNRQIKRASRDEKTLNVVFDIEASHTKHVITDAFITAINQDNIVKIWIQHYDLIYNIPLCKPEQMHYIEINIIKDIMFIINKTTMATATLHLYQPVHVTMVPFPSQNNFNKKLDVKINEIQHMFQI